MIDLLDALDRIKAIKDKNPFPLNNGKKFGYNVGINTAIKIMEGIRDEYMRDLEATMASPEVIRELNSFPAKIEERGKE